MFSGEVVDTDDTIVLEDVPVFHSLVLSLRYCCVFRRGGRY